MATKRSSEAARALAAAAFGVVAPIAYLGQRLYERARSGPIDPLLVLRDAHTAFYWRACTALWWAGLATLFVYAWAARRDAPESAARALRLAVAPLALAIAVVAWRYA